MSINQNNAIFRHIINISGLMIELVSDNIQLLELNFIKTKKIKNNDRIPDPLKKSISFLNDYFKGEKIKIEIILNAELSNFILTDNSNKLYLNMAGYTEKEIQVYRELLKVEPGKKISYSELAFKSGIISGARFVGNCMAGNRFPIMIPCHRVIKKDGSIGNYSGGVGIKEFLLKHENEYKDTSTN